MAIEVTQFNYLSDAAANMNEVYNWMLENAAEYFTGGINKDETYWKIQCQNSDSYPVFMLPFRSNNADHRGIVQSSLSSEYAIYHGEISSDNSTISKAYKTPYGIAFVDYSAGHVWFISKTDQETTCFAGIARSWYSLYNCRLMLGDFSNSRTFYDSNAGTTMDACKNQIRIANDRGKTTFTPIAFDGGTYSTDLFLTTFTQLNIESGAQEVIIDNMPFVYDGILALRG